MRTSYVESTLSHLSKSHLPLPWVLIGLNSVVLLAVANRPDRMPISLVRKTGDSIPVLPPPPSRKEFRALIEHRLLLEGEDFIKWLGKTDRSTISAPSLENLQQIWREVTVQGNVDFSTSAAPTLAVSQAPSLAPTSSLSASIVSNGGETQGSHSHGIQLDDEMEPERRRKRFEDFKHKYALVSVFVVCIPFLAPILWTGGRSTAEACGGASRLPNDEATSAGAEFVMASVCTMIGDYWPQFAMHILFSCWWLLWFALFCAHGPSA